MTEKLYRYEGPEKGSWGTSRDVECPHCQARQTVLRSILTPTCISCKRDFYCGDYIYDKNLTFRGEVVTRGSITVEETGNLQASFSATTISIKGKLTGKARAVEKVEIFPTGEMYGEIESGSLRVQEGATLVGTWKVGRKFHNSVTATPGPTP